MSIEPGTLVHYHSRAFNLVPDFDYSERHQRGDKPAGFWVSVAGEDDWPSWCRSEEFALESLTVPHVVTLTAEANVLRINSEAELVAFDAKYHIADSWYLERGIESHWSIDWPRLYGEYDGIIIAPYQWKQRYGDLNWYYGWDCASGCIWNLAAIAALNVEQVSA
ncbi:hypothetical protein CH276_22530 [Rhodococcus sp. 06-470-2]|uniref:hypothetical protein n=1 Tax=unclassified Rhodococcus (in: high G+C Gram-positive bacteria) TaxID=192944 RepID=UPI000B9B37B4|nr:MULTISPECIES: hypothetical protein [unclassified Rhodococcus (in: high G+C Gram-positive bacteria)]OZC59227.1 hypothetical protein CH276_22530 [Rhodococcus sp. 06-470-2]OZE66814.1 hypothetical protein CH265_07855 [Rhodococcus sp. 05-2221-1B]